MSEVCELGGVDDGTLRVCCSTHRKVLCAHHYARSHFVETVVEWQSEFACNFPSDPSVCEGAPPPGTRGEG